MASRTDWRPGTSVCRCCFAEGCYKDISTEYFWMGKREVYSEMLTETFDVSISYAQGGGPNSNSRLICEPCISRLRDAADFKKQVVECERVFQQHLSQPEGSVTDIEVNVEPMEKDEVKLERVKLENKLDDDDDFDDTGPGFPDDDDDDDDMDDQPLTKLASKIPKKEVDLLELLEPAKPEKRKSSTKSKASPAKKAKKVETPKPSASTAKPAHVEKKKKEHEHIEDQKPDMSKINAQIILKYSTLLPFRQTGRGLGCSFCKDEYVDPDEFRRHIETAHKYLDKSIAVKFEVNVSQIRVDVTNIGCKDCPKKFITIDALARHLKEEHNYSINLDVSLGLVPIKLEKGRYECVVCGEVFNALRPLWKHSGEHFAQNICYICGRKLETRNGLQTHLERHDHEKSEGYCKVCKTTFPSVFDKKKHYVKSPRCKASGCKICGMRFRSKESKDKHLVEIHGIQIKSWPCPECSEVFPYRALRYIHFKTTHTSDYQCSYCELKFWSKTTLDNHVARIHTKEKRFKCNLCDASYYEKACLTRHMVLHDDSRKFPCKVCGQLFVRRHRMKEHVVKIHPEVEIDDDED